MNDRGYGVIRNIQDAQYGGRRYYADLHTPDFERLAQSIALPFHRVRDLGQIGATLRDALAQAGPMVIEIDMTAIGPFAQQFSGPAGEESRGLSAASPRRSASRKEPIHGDADTRRRRMAPRTRRRLRLALPRRRQRQRRARGGERRRRRGGDRGRRRRPAPARLGEPQAARARERAVPDQRADPRARGGARAAAAARQRQADQRDARARRERRRHVPVLRRRVRDARGDADAAARRLPHDERARADGRDRGDHAVELADRERGAEARARARRRQRGDREARRGDAARGARARPHLRSRPAFRKAS